MIIAVWFKETSISVGVLVTFTFQFIQNTTTSLLSCMSAKQAQIDNSHQTHCEVSALATCVSGSILRFFESFFCSAFNGLSPNNLSDLLLS